MVCFNILKELSCLQIIIKVHIKPPIFLAFYYLLQLTHTHRLPTQRYTPLFFFIGGEKLDLFYRFFGLFLKILAVV